jgi:hypothetical protein
MGLKFLETALAPPVPLSGSVRPRRGQAPRTPPLSFSGTSISPSFLRMATLISPTEILLLQFNFVSYC